MSSTGMAAENNVKKIYLTVIDEVLSNVREAFLDEGYDEQLLQELKNLWVSKLNGSRALQAAEEISNGASNNSSGLRLPTTKEPANNVKTEMDSATRSALNALPQSFGASSNHQNGKKLHAPQLDGTADEYVTKKPSLNVAKMLEKIRKSSQKVDITLQLDGNGDDSDIDDDDDDDIGEVSIHGDDDDDDVDDDKGNNDNSEYEGKEDPDPLNSDDDLTEPGTPDSNADMFDTDNVIVCQYDKITRIKNRWKFHLKDGIMNINAKDYLFSKANGDAEW